MAKEVFICTMFKAKLPNISLRGSIQKDDSMRLFSSIAKTLATALVVAAAAFNISPSVAGEYPSKPVTFIVPFSAGGSNDIMARQLGKNLSKMWGQPVVIENRPGAGATIGSAHLARRPADGYTIMIASVTFTMKPAIMKNLPYDPINDFTPISMLGSVPLILGARPDFPAKTPTEFFDYVRSQKGKLNYAATGTGSIGHFAGELLHSAMGLDVTVVQYKGGAPAMVDVMGGHVDYFIGSMTQMMPHINSGKMIPIAVTSKERSPAAPDIPSFAEFGVKDYDLYQWWGILAPAGLPDDILTKLNKDINTVLQMDEMVQFMAKKGATPAVMSAPEFKEVMISNIKRWKEVAKARNITAN